MILLKLYNLNNANESWDEWTVNDIDEATWTDTFEPAGAVFLPTAGDRRGTAGGGTGPEGLLPFYGFYWSTTYPRCLFFAKGDIRSDYGSYAREGQSVRLVADGK